MTTDLVAFLRARLDEDEQAAQLAAEESGGAWSYDERAVVADREGDMVAVGSQDFMGPEHGVHIARHDPARVLAEVEAKRQIVDRYERAMENRRAHPDDLASAGALLALHGAVKLHALPYADHPDYRQKWRP
ncbi:DUF6221 family protein [Streptomyces zhihengii]